MGLGHAGVEPTGRDEPRGVIRQRGANWGVSTWESPKRVACCTAESRSTTTSAPSKNSALKHTCCSSSEVSHLASTAEAMAASNWSRIAGSDRPARPVLCNQQWPNQRMARLKVGGGLGPGPSHRPGTRSSGLPPRRARLASPTLTMTAPRTGSGSGSESTAGWPLQSLQSVEMQGIAGVCARASIRVEVIPHGTIGPDGLSRVNELRLPRECQVTRTGAQGVPPERRAIAILALWASETPPLAQCRKKAQTIDETPRRSA